MISPSYPNSPIAPNRIPLLTQSASEAAPPPAHAGTDTYVTAVTSTAQTSALQTQRPPTRSQAVEAPESLLNRGAVAGAVVCGAAGIISVAWVGAASGANGGHVAGMAAITGIIFGTVGTVLGRLAAVAYYSCCARR